MLDSLGLYLNTIKYMKPSQLYYRILKKVGIKIGIGVKPFNNEITPLNVIPELDFAPELIARFSCKKILNGELTIFHSTENIDWDSPWYYDKQTPLWNFNLHYCEYLYSLIYSGEQEEVKRIMKAWINCNPQELKGIGWDPYTLALRLIVWINIYPKVKDEKIEQSIFEQYLYLSEHLEKDILGNHLFEELKTLVLCAKFFKDEKMLVYAVRELRHQCSEQILPDGMHFELSPMYHNIILEDVIRVAYATGELTEYIKPMLDVAYTLENGIERLPLFNDCGNNVSKNIETLCFVCRKYFMITPSEKKYFLNAGYYIFTGDAWKLIVDAGQPGPRYLPAHSHCDAGSFELFIDGKPVVVNCGTYAYQNDRRLFFKSTVAHNTSLIDNTEQSELWGIFRMARRAKVTVDSYCKDAIKIRITNYKGISEMRTISLKDDNLTIIDEAIGHGILQIFHFITNKKLLEDMYYSAEFGCLSFCHPIKNSCKDYASTTISLKTGEILS